MSDDDTRAADTATHEPATEIVPPATQAAPELAWSADDGTDDEHSDHQPWPRVLVVTLIAITGLIGLAVIGLGATYFQEVTARPLAPTSNPYATFTPTVAPPPPALALAPSTVTVTAEAPPPAPAVVPTPPTTAAPPRLVAPAGASADDERLLNDLEKYPNSAPVHSDPSMIIYFAHRYCGLIGQPDRPPLTQIKQQLQTESGWDSSALSQLMSSATMIYPYC